MTPDTAPAQPPAHRLYGRLFAALRRLPVWWLLPLLAILGTLTGAAYGLLAAPRYAATSYVLVSPRPSGDRDTAIGFAQAYGRVVTGQAVLARARPGTGATHEELRRSVRAVTSPDAPMIEITGTETRARRAAAIANRVAHALTAHANASAGRSRVELSVVSAAPVPSAPASPSAKLAAAVGLCAGGLVGCLVLLVRPGGRRRRPAPRGAIASAVAAAVPAPATGKERIPGKVPDSGAAPASSPAPAPGRERTSDTASASGPASGPNPACAPSGDRVPGGPAEAVGSGITPEQAPGDGSDSAGPGNGRTAPPAPATQPSAPQPFASVNRRGGPSARTKRKKKPAAGPAGPAPAQSAKAAGKGRR